MRRKGIFMALILCLIGFSGWGTMSAEPRSSLQETTEMPSPLPEDVRTPGAVLKAFYESLTFAEGGRPDFDRFKSLFASAASPCVRTSPGAVLAANLMDFLENFGERVRSGALKSFREAEISRRTEIYGNVAQVLSVYNKTVNSADPAKSVRGINSLQLCFLEGGWRIVSLAWEDETPENPIPEKYLK